MKNKTTSPDIYFVAAMISLGAKLDGVDRSDPKHIKFTLYHPSYEFDTMVTGNSISSHMKDFEDYEKDWANGCLMVNAIAYKDALQRVRAIIHSF